MVLDNEAVTKIAELEAELAEAQATIAALESLLTDVEVNLQVSLAEISLLMADRTYTV